MNPDVDSGRLSKTAKERPHELLALPLQPFLQTVVVVVIVVVLFESVTHPHLSAAVVVAFASESPIVLVKFVAHGAGVCNVM